MHRAFPVLAVCFGLASTSRAQAPAATGDPTKEEVSLGSRAGWDASLVYRGDAGIWNVKAIELLPRYGTPEVIASDDKGRSTVLVSYSGKWTPLTPLTDGEWLGPVAFGDLDPTIDGPELYTGGKGGRLWQIRPLAKSGFDVKLVAEFPAEEIHTLVLGEFDAALGAEMLVFLSTGPVALVTGGSSGLAIQHDAGRSGGRVRDAIPLPAPAGESPWIATVSRDGEVALVRLAERRLERRTVLREPMGFGRLALRPQHPGAPPVLYVSRDDGCVLRLERRRAEAGPAADEAAAWKRELVYAGPQGPRGLAAGRFDPDPGVETVAVFGYSKAVELLSRKGSGPWRVETIFEDLEAGHWLETAELDGRNSTDELLGSGYASRVFLLARPPGTGIPGVPAFAAPREAKGTASMAPPGPRPVRVAVAASRPAIERLTPLSYRGGFVTKTPVYETLVGRDGAGRIAPRLASSFRLEDGGRSVVFRLREGARFHDGSPVDAAAVALHFRRWVGLPEHAWIGASDRIRSVTAPSPSELRITMDLPYALLPDLCAINPCSIQAPGALDREGNFRRPVGTGPFRFEEALDGAAGERPVFRYALATSAPGADPAASAVDLVLFDEAADSVDALLAGEVDAVVDSWTEMIPRDRIAELRADARFDVTSSPGSSVRYLSFRMDGGPTGDAALRRRVAAAVDREELVRSVELGVADPCATWAGPAVLDWPKSGRSPAPERTTPAASGAPPPLRVVALATVAREEALARAVAGQLARAGLDATVDVLDADAFRDAIALGRFDIRFERTWGIPYDPDLSLRARFLPPDARPSAAENRYHGVDPRATAIVRRLDAATEDADRRALYAEFQALVDSEAVVVPLFVPRRVAAVVTGRGPVALDADLYRIDLGSLMGTR